MNTMNSKVVPLLLFLLSPLILASQQNIPKLSPYYRDELIARHNTHEKNVSTFAAPDNFKTYYYNQTLDHFNYGPSSYATFTQKYVLDSTHWGGANSSSPIFAYLGAEAPLDGDWNFIGFLQENAPFFNSLSVYIEHRFYGESVPFGSMEDAMKNKTLRGYFNSAQALGDYAEVLLHIKKRFSAPNSPIIVVGGSYGGMLASWFRLKYPHIALGALASSAPILYFDNITPQDGYYSIVTKDYKEVSKSCYKTIRKSWSVIDRVASKPNGLSILSKKFKTCSPLSSSGVLKDFLDSLYSATAQYNAPPVYPVTTVCNGLDGAPKHTDILGRIFQGVVSHLGDQSCYDIGGQSYSSETSTGWLWQTCSEMVMPVGRGENETMFPAEPFILKEFINMCKNLYGVAPRPHWITTYYGGHNIKRVLHRYGSNIIFANGLKDPYSSAGVLEDISKSVVAVTTSNGSHCLDILTSAESDPVWLVEQRIVEVLIIEGWIKQYYTDLKAFKK